MVGLQSTQALLDRGDYLLAVFACTVRITRVGLVGELGGEHEPVAAPFEQLAEDGFRRPVGVDVGGVDDIAASVGEQVQHPRADIWGRPPAPVVTEGHGAQRHLRDPHAGLTQKPVTHEIPSLLGLATTLDWQRKPDTTLGHPAYAATNAKPTTPASKLIVITCPERCSRM